MVRNHQYQFTFNESQRGELYDLEKDPYQLKNECYNPAYANIKKQLLQTMSEYMEELNDPARGWFNRIREFY